MGKWFLGILLAIGAIAVASSTAPNRSKPSARSPYPYNSTGYYHPSGSTAGTTSTRATTDRVAPQVAENGSYFGEISEATGRPKTVYVNGYFRSDGTYVRSHYRSSPSQSSIPSSTRTETSYKPHVAENGSYYGEKSKITGLPKTTYVQGYYRKDGTYVRSHYRSRR